MNDNVLLQILNSLAGMRKRTVEATSPSAEMQARYPDPAAIMGLGSPDFSFMVPAAGALKLIRNTDDAAALVSKGAQRWFMKDWPSMSPGQKSIVAEWMEHASKKGLPWDETVHKTFDEILEIVTRLKGGK